MSDQQDSRIQQPDGGGKAETVVTRVEREGPRDRIFNVEDVDLVISVLGMGGLLFLGVAIGYGLGLQFVTHEFGVSSTALFGHPNTTHWSIIGAAGASALAFALGAQWILNREEGDDD